MGREVRGSSASAPGALPPRANRRYGAVTSSTPLNRDLTFEHMAESEQGYCSLASKMEEPVTARRGGLGQLLRRVVVGAVVITFFAAAVSTVFGGRTVATAESGVRGAVAEYPKMAAEVRALR